MSYFAHHQATNQLTQSQIVFIDRWFLYNGNAMSAVKSLWPKTHCPERVVQRLMRNEMIRKAISQEKARLLAASQLQRDSALGVVSEIAMDDAVAPRDRVSAVRQWSSMTGNDAPAEVNVHGVAPAGPSIFQLIVASMQGIGQGVEPGIGQPVLDAGLPVPKETPNEDQTTGQGQGPRQGRIVAAQDDTPIEPCLDAVCDTQGDAATTLAPSQPIRSEASLKGVGGEKD